MPVVYSAAIFWPVLLVARTLVCEFSCRQSPPLFLALSCAPSHNLFGGYPIGLFLANWLHFSGPCPFRRKDFAHQSGSSCRSGLILAHLSGRPHSAVKAFPSFAFRRHASSRRLAFAQPSVSIGLRLVYTVLGNPAARTVYWLSGSFFARFHFVFPAGI